MAGCCDTLRVFLFRFSDVKMLPIVGLIMLEIKLATELGSALEREARRARKSKATLVREAVAHFLQEADDYQAVLAFRKRRGRTRTLAEVKRRRGRLDLRQRQRSN